jgi:hypothetical protein
LYTVLVLGAATHTGLKQSSHTLPGSSKVRRTVQDRGRMRCRSVSTRRNAVPPAT